MQWSICKDPYLATVLTFQRASSRTIGATHMYRDLMNYSKAVHRYALFYLSDAHDTDSNTPHARINVNSVSLPFTQPTWPNSVNPGILSQSVQISQETRTKTDPIVGGAYALKAFQGS